MSGSPTTDKMEISLFSFSFGLEGVGHESSGGGSRMATQKPIQLAPRVEALTEKKARLEQRKADTKAKSLRQALELASTDVIDAYVKDLIPILNKEGRERVGGWCM